ncbi:MAG: hypothetical protein ACLQUY_01925 [Ktedonobacterales bacterium]
MEPAPTRRYEPADRPVGMPEYALFVALDAAAFAAFIWSTRLVISVAFVIAALTLLVSLARLLWPTPRYSLTRSAFLVIALLVLVMLVSLGGATH